MSAGSRRSPAKGHGAKSAAVRERAILALLSERTVAMAAAQAGVNESTLRRWLTDDAEFKSTYDAARRATYEAGISRVAPLMVRAVETLEELLDAKKHPAVRLGAARTLAELAQHRHDADTIMRKLDELEAAQSRR